MSVSESERQEVNELTEKIVGAAIEIHRELGPGLLESAYEQCLCHELTLRHIAWKAQVPLAVRYKGVSIACGYVIDMVVEGRVLIELKTVAKVLPVHEAQVMTYLKLSGLSVGLLMNFYVPVMKDGLKRFVHDF